MDYPPLAISELEEMPLLEGLSPEERSRLTALFTRRVYPAGADMIRQGEPCDSLYLVESGSVVVHTRQRGRLAHRGPGECLGEISMFTGGPARATVTTLTEVVAQEVPQAEMRLLLEELPLLARNFCRQLGRRLAASSEAPEPCTRILLVSMADGIGFGFALNLAASVAHHFQQPVALVNLSDPAPNEGSDAAPLLDHPLELLTVVRPASVTSDTLPPLMDRLARQYRYVMAWTQSLSAGPAAAVAPLLTSTDRILLAVPYEAFRRAGSPPWCSRKSAATELIALGAPEPRSPATSEAIERDTGLKVAALLPTLPQTLERRSAAPGWVLEHPDALFAQATARLARRLVGKTVGLALGAGAGRGHAHFGVLQALERLGIRPDLMAGSSVGAGIAMLYGQGLPYHEMELIGRRLGQLIRRPRLPVHSLLAGSGLDRAFRSGIPPHLRIEDLSLPCAFVAADLLSGEEVVLRRGCAWLSARASATIPGIFPPARVDGRLLVDGGVVSPVPCRVARAMGADIVLGISLECNSEVGVPVNGAAAMTGAPECGGRNRQPTWPQILLRAFDLQQQSLTRQCLQAADVPIRVFTPSISLTDFRGGPVFLEAGERAVEAAQARLRELLPWVERASPLRR